jgi:PAS domain S-box-containing protein
MTVPRLILRLEPLADQPPPVEDASDGTVQPPTIHSVVDIADPEPGVAATPLAQWAAAVAAALDACLVLDPSGAVVSISTAALELLGCAETSVVGRRLLDVIEVVDLDTFAPDPEYAERIPPLAVLGGRGLMRSLLRVRHSDDALVTVDVSSAPIHDETGVGVGSVSFLASMASL